MQPSGRHSAKRVRVTPVWELEMSSVVVCLQPATGIEATRQFAIKIIKPVRKAARFARACTLHLAGLPRVENAE